MAGKEVDTCPALFYNEDTKRAVHIGISKRVIRAIEKMYSGPSRRECQTITYRLESGEIKRVVPFTDVLVVEVFGPGHKPPEEFIP